MRAYQDMVLFTSVPITNTNVHAKDLARGFIMFTSLAMLGLVVAPYTLLLTFQARCGVVATAAP